jgi:hypothetical protein
MQEPFGILVRVSAGSFPNLQVARTTIKRRQAAHPESGIPSPRPKYPGASETTTSKRTAETRSDWLIEESELSATKLQAFNLDWAIEFHCSETSS